MTVVETCPATLRINGTIIGMVKEAYDLLVRRRKPYALICLDEPYPATLEPLCIEALACAAPTLKSLCNRVRQPFRTMSLAIDCRDGVA
jgi:hypothetical protein